MEKIMEENKQGIEALNEIIKELHEPKTVEVDGRTMIFYPADLERIDVTAITERQGKAPKFLEGYAPLHSQTSFCDYVNRFKDEDSAIFFDETDNRFVAVFDFDKGGADKKARWRKHGAKYEAKLSDELKFWTRYNEEWLSQEAFAAFLEKRCLDFIEADEEHLPEETKRLRALLGGRFATPTQMLELGRGIAITRDQKASVQYNRQTGARSLNFEDTDKGVDVPSLFMIAIPMYKNGKSYYSLPAQIRFRVREGVVSWQYELHRLEESEEAAIKGMIDEIKKETGLPVFLGNQADLP